MRNVSPRGLVTSLVLAAMLPTLVLFGAGSPIAAASSTPVTMPQSTAAHTPTPHPFQETGTPVLARQATPAAQLTPTSGAVPTPVPAAGPPAAARSRLILALGGVVVVGGMLVGLIGILRSR